MQHYFLLSQYTKAPIVYFFIFGVVTKVRYFVFEGHKSQNIM